MGHGGGEGRFPNLMTAAVHRDVSNSYFFSIVFDVVDAAFGLKGKAMRFASTQGI